MLELPLVFPPIETYQGSSFLLGVLMADPDFSDIQYNRYINMECHNSNFFSKLIVNFKDPLWEPLRQAGLLDIWLHKLSEYDEDTLEDLLTEELDEGRYLLLYKLDEYFLSYSVHYKEDHFIHDTYVYGYDENDFYVLAYYKEHLSRLKVARKEIIQALLSDVPGENTVANRDFCSIRPAKDKEIRLDKALIKEEVKNFYETEITEPTEDDLICGFGVYTLILEAVKNLQNDPFVEMQSIRCLMEHKLMMKRRVIRLFGESDPKVIECIKELDQLIEEINLIFKLMMKYKLTRKPELINKIYDRTVALRDGDKAWYDCHFRRMCNE